jgi:hypothetical protein
MARALRLAKYPCDCYTWSVVLFWHIYARCHEKDCQILINLGDFFLRHRTWTKVNNINNQSVRVLPYIYNLKLNKGIISTETWKHPTVEKNGLVMLLQLHTSQDSSVAFLRSRYIKHKILARLLCVDIWDYKYKDVFTNHNVLNCRRILNSSLYSSSGPMVG